MVEDRRKSEVMSFLQSEEDQRFKIIFEAGSFSKHISEIFGHLLTERVKLSHCASANRANMNICRCRSISFPESTFPLSSGTGNKRLWDKAFSDNRILVIPVELRRRERVFQDGLLAESAYSSTFHKAIEFSLKKLGKPKLE